MKHLLLLFLFWSKCRLRAAFSFRHIVVDEAEENGRVPSCGVGRLQLTRTRCSCRFGLPVKPKMYALLFLFHFGYLHPLSLIKLLSDIFFQITHSRRFCQGQTAPPPISLLSLTLLSYTTICQCSKRMQNIYTDTISYPSLLSFILLSYTIVSSLLSNLNIIKYLDKSIHIRHSAHRIPIIAIGTDIPHLPPLSIVVYFAFLHYRFQFSQLSFYRT